jgi:hypothetical protein
METHHMLGDWCGINSLTLLMYDKVAMFLLQKRRDNEWRITHTPCKVAGTENVQCCYWNFFPSQQVCVTCIIQHENHPNDFWSEAVTPMGAATISFSRETIRKFSYKVTCKVFKNVFTDRLRVSRKEHQKIFNCLLMFGTFPFFNLDILSIRSDDRCTCIRPLVENHILGMWVFR